MAQTQTFSFQQILLSLSGKNHRKEPDGNCMERKKLWIGESPPTSENKRTYTVNQKTNPIFFFFPGTSIFVKLEKIQIVLLIRFS